MNKPILLWFGSAVMLVAVIVFGGEKAFSSNDTEQSPQLFAFFFYSSLNILTRLLMLAGAVLLARNFDLLPFSGWRSDCKQRRLARLGVCFILVAFVIEMGSALYSLWMSLQVYFRYMEGLP